MFGALAWVALMLLAGLVLGVVIMRHAYEDED